MKERLLGAGRAGGKIVMGHWGLMLALIVYAWGAKLMLPTYRWQINPDGVGYMSIARELLAGRFWDAINAYWSPLVSWLLVPVLACGIEPVLAFKLLSLFLGAVGLGLAWWLMGNLCVPRLSRTAAVLALVPMMIWYALQVITSDLIVAVVLLGYLAHLTRPRTGLHVGSAVGTGVWMGLAYLAKAYALWFVAVHYVLVKLAALWRRDEGAEGPPRRQVLRNAGIALAVFSLISTAWAGVLAGKFGRFTYGSTGQFNWAYNGPDFQMPMHTWGLIAPPNDSAVSAWDDATYFNVQSWNPLTPQRNWDHFKKNLQRNYRALVKMIESYSIFVYFIVVGALLVAGSAAEPTWRRPNGVVALALVLYPCGYMVLHLDQRFFWIMPMALVVLSASVPAALAGTAMLKGRLNALLPVVVAAVSFAYPAWVDLTAPGEQGQGLHEAAEWVKAAVPAGARVAANGRWDMYLYISFYDHLRYFGVPGPGQSAEEIKAQLDKYQIEYFFVTGGRRYPFLEGKDPIHIDEPAPSGLGRSIRVYRLR